MMKMPPWLSLFAALTTAAWLGQSQSLFPGALENPAVQLHPTPEPINLDLAPAEPATPDQVAEQQLAVLAVLEPEDFHNWLLQIEPGRQAREQFAAFAILNPSEFRRAHPKTAIEMQAEITAARAILNSIGMLPASP